MDECAQFLGARGTRQITRPHPLQRLLGDMTSTLASIGTQILNKVSARNHPGGFNAKLAYDDFCQLIVNPG